jgi:hypothetical protein
MLKSHYINYFGQDEKVEEENYRLKKLLEE